MTNEIEPTASDLVELGSTAWLERVAQALASEAADSRWRNLEFSMSETLADPPAELRPTDGELGWSCHVAGGAVSFEARPAADAAFRATVDYRAATRVAPLLYGTRDGAAVHKSDLEARGLVANEGSRPDAAIDFMIAVHDRLAVQTSPPGDR